MLVLLATVDTTVTEDKLLLATELADIWVVLTADAVPATELA